MPAPFRESFGICAVTVRIQMPHEQQGSVVKVYKKSTDNSCDLCKNMIR